MKRLLRSTAPVLFACLAAIAARPAAAQNFAAPVTLSISGAYLALTDINGDGLLDLVAAYPGSPGYYTYITGSPGSVQFSFGDGKGNFASPQYTSAYFNGTSGPLNLTLGDFNNDGIQDVICPVSGGTTVSPGSSGGYPFNGSTIAVFRGGSGGTLGFGSQYAVGDTPTAALVTDFNHDGIPDTAVTNASGILTVYLGVGGGLYQGGMVYPVGSNPIAIRSGDFNHDGRPDLATVNTSDGTLSMLINNGDGTFQKPKRLAVGSGLKDAALADLNGDGRTDIVALRSATYPSLGEIDVFNSNADGTFTLSKNYPTSNTATALLLADFSGSGKLDALTNDAVLLRGIGSAAGNTALGTYSGDLAVGDVNGDGKMDFIVGSKLYLNIGLAKSPVFSLIIDVEPEGFPSPNNSMLLNGYMILHAPNTFSATTSFYAEFTQMYSNLPATGSVFRITSFNHLTVDVAFDGTGGATQYRKVILPAGDANGDNSIDSTDFGILIGAYTGLASVPGSGYDARADFNLDGSVDAIDFGLLIGNFGRQGDL